MGTKEVSKLVVLNTKTFEELKTEATSDLQAIGFNTSPGAIAKLFMNIVNKNIANLYNTLTVNHIRAFVTTADGEALDAIGKLVQCYRLRDEDDDNFRYRIVNQCLTLATSNETAIRLTALIVDGVKDIILKPYSMGAGSFTVIVLSDEDVTSTGILNAVKEKLLSVHGYGIRYNVISPTLTYISIKQKIHLNNKLSDIEKQEIRYDVQLALTDYLSNLKIGEDIVIDKITQTIMNVSENILQESNISLYINGEKALYVNQSCRWFERFIVSRENDNIVIV
jgi:uncharacterized phage protein gp47/JayE